MRTSTSSPSPITGTKTFLCKNPESLLKFAGFAEEGNMSDAREALLDDCLLMPPNLPVRIIYSHGGIARVAIATGQYESFGFALLMFIDNRDRLKTNAENPAPAAKPALTREELQHLQEQLNAGWILTAAKRYSEDLIVDIQLSINKDKTVRGAKPVDQTRYKNDSYFREAADSAILSLQQPACRQLNLPDNKFEAWEHITVTFDPRDLR